ncbi:MAG: SDR family NAD(P)-dependent oxidoreductase, partial [Proteobacteria bacterium]|nr:SDR family NAD(P)-dependent oxidoreductase [Pseudomonadota bacterium]
MKLKDKVALVTGAGQGMGRAIAQRFAAEGATVVALDLNLEAAQQTIADLAGQHLALALNVADSAAVNAMVDSVVAQRGRVDVLVNNAGTGGMD